MEFKERFNYYLNTYNITLNDIHKESNISLSVLSRYKNGLSSPKIDSEHLIEITNAIYKVLKKNNTIVIKEDILNDLTNSLTKNNTIIYDFLNTLDSFDLKDYLNQIKYDNIKIPSSHLRLPKSKNYYGIKGYKKSQTNLIKKLIISKKTDDIIYFSNMLSNEDIKDTKFTKKITLGLVKCLKKGYHLNMIHNLNRPFNEIIMELNKWIPFYMTGQISPYYFKNDINDFYAHIIITSNNIALSGEVLNGDMDNSKYYLTNNRKEIKIFRNNSQTLLKKASPLIKIYREENANDYKDMFKKKIINHSILYNFPIYTISIDLLNKILDKNKVPREEGERIVNYYMKVRNNIEKYLKDNTILDEIVLISKEEFNNKKLGISLTNIFYDKKIEYSYEDYIEHHRLTEEFKKEYKNYKYKIINNGFNNINIHFTTDNEVIISKENVPSIHFLILYPKLIEGCNQITKENK